MNTFGNNIRITIFGESHGPVVGVTMDGVPSGLELDVNDFEADIARRKPGAEGTTARHEQDLPRILGGLYEGHTTGAPLTMVFDNADIVDAHYDKFREIPRPGHADLTAMQRYGGWNDPRGGGQFSGRMTLPIVAAGTVAKKILAMWAEDGSCSGIDMKAEVVQLGGSADRTAWKGLIEAAQAEGDSLGAVVECRAEVPAGLGDPFWNSVESLLSHAVFSIPGVRGIEFGDGCASAAMRGSAHNDPIGEDGIPVKNGSGGCNGGITNGAPLLFRVAFKPTSSIARRQDTLNIATGQTESLECGGRHDVCFALRTPVVVEAVTALVLADLIY